MEAIRIWLSSKRVYAIGVKLYNYYGKDYRIKRLFADPAISDFKIQKLKESLEQLLPTAKKTVSKPVTIAVANPVPGSQVIQKIVIHGWSDNMDETEKAMYDNWKPKFIELMNLSSRVGDFAREGKSDPYKRIEAGTMAIRICDLEDEVEHIYDERDYYLQHDQIMERWPFGEPCLDPMLIPQKLANSERYARDYRNKLKKTPDDEIAKAWLEKHEWFIAHYKKVLKID